MAASSFLYLDIFNRAGYSPLHDGRSGFMHVKLTSELRGPEGEIREVLVKVQGNHGNGSVWYIIRPTEGYETDGSPIERDDKIHYMHPEVEGILKPHDELDVRKYTFIPHDHVKEVTVFEKNTQAKSLLSKEW
jgi:hypothetical protein